MKNKIKKHILTTLLFVTAVACNSSSNSITVVQNGIGIVKNGIGSISAENMGTVIYDVATDAVTSSRATGQSKVTGRLGGTAEIIASSDKNKVEIVFDRYRTREAYPAFESGTLSLDLKETPLDDLIDQTKGSSQSLVANVDSDESLAIQASASTSDLSVGEKTLEANIDYDLKTSAEGYLGGQMKGQVKTAEKTYEVDQAYDAPIILRLEINQDKVEPGQQLQSQIVIASNTPMKSISLDIVAESENVRQAWKGVEGEYEDDDVFDQAYPGIWTYESDEAVEEDTPVGKVAFSNIRFFNKAGLGSERARNDTISLEVVPVGSGVEQSFLPSLSELLAGLAGNGAETGFLVVPDETDELLIEMDIDPLTDPKFMAALNERYTTPEGEGNEFEITENGGGPFVHYSYIMAWVQAPHRDRDLVIYNKVLDRIVVFEPNIGDQFDFSSNISSSGQYLVWPVHDWYLLGGEFRILNLQTAEWSDNRYNSLFDYLTEKASVSSESFPIDRVSRVHYRLNPENKSQIIVTAYWNSFEGDEGEYEETGEISFVEPLSRLIDQR